MGALQLPPSQAGSATFSDPAGKVSLNVQMLTKAAQPQIASILPGCAGVLAWVDGSEGAATPIAWTGETGTFWFFSPSNVELAVKVLDGRAVNGHFWVFYASLSDVDFDLEVLDTTTGARRTYHNPRGTMASRADVDAF